MIDDNISTNIIKQNSSKNGNIVEVTETEELILDIFRAVCHYWRYELCLVIGVILGWVIF